MGKNRPLRPGRETDPFDVAATLNNATYIDYYERLKNIAITTFRWEGLPYSVNERFLETVLFEQGRVLFFNDPDSGFMALPCVPSGQLNVYREPLKWQAVSIGYNKFYGLDDCALIRNTYTMRPTAEAIRLYAWRLYNAERVTDVNIGAQRKPVVILCNENEVLTFKNLFSKYAGNEDAIIGKRGLDIESIKTLDVSTKFVGLELQQYKRRIWSEALSYLGVAGYNEDKRERLVSGEIDTSEQQANAELLCFLKPRQEAADLINRMYGLNVTVHIRGGDGDSNIYDTSENFD